ncbi:sodium:calcium antiporter [Piscinibacter sakaiensis]|uniref:sodium:calcium antiporter n=1 Tax=Piscinibacter sakaiensis TaxID=1547922 RepID=UPI003AAD7D4A
MNILALSLQFFACAAVIGAAGFVLSRSADRLAGMLGWGRGWVGLALLATVTSLPELAAGISAVVVVDAPNLAVGNALGACVANLAFLVIIDAVQRHQPIYRAAGPTQLLSAGFSVVMLGFVALSLVVGRNNPALLHVGLYSPLLLGFYLLALRSVHAHERDLLRALTSSGAAPEPVDQQMLRREWRRFGLAAVAVVGAGIWLPEAADQLAQALGLSRSFVGTIFLALATTLPEMAVTLSALRIGALDMAIGNLLGSNLFNVLILAIDDLFYVRGPLLADASAAHGGTAVAAMLMSGLVIIGLVMRPQGRVLRVTSWISIGLVAAYAINLAVIYLAAA